MTTENKINATAAEVAGRLAEEMAHGTALRVRAEKAEQALADAKAALKICHEELRTSVSLEVARARESDYEFQKERAEKAEARLAQYEAPVGDEKIEAALVEAGRHDGNPLQMPSRVYIGLVTLARAYRQLRQNHQDLQRKFIEQQRELEDWKRLLSWGGTPAHVEAFVKGQQDRIYAAQLEAQKLAEFEGAARKTDWLIHTLSAEANATAPVRIEYPVGEWEVCGDIAKDGSVKLMGRWAEDGSPYFMSVPNQLVSAIQALQRLARVAHEASRVLILRADHSPDAGKMVKPSADAQKGGVK